jgi:signal transduction histidine kinase
VRLRTRLTAAVVAVSTLGTFVLGGVAITEVRASRIDAVDRTLLAVKTQVAANPGDPVTAAILAVDSSPSALALGFLAPGTAFTWLRDLPGVTVPEPTEAERERALERPVGSVGGFRLVAAQLEDGATLLVVASLAEIEQQTSNEVVFLAAFWILLALLMGALIRVLVRRDVREIEHLVSLATEVADGVGSIEIPEGARATEVGVLASALRRMVTSLRGAVIAEQAANQRMQEFLGDASHELRTPLTVIKGYLELLEQDVEPAQRERAMHRMRAEAQRMDLLINDLLLLAEIGSPAPELLEAIDLTSMVRVMVDDLREFQPERPVEATVSAQVWIRAVPSHVQRAIGNAMANIHRHTAPTDPVRIELHPESTTARLVIEDGGPGLSEEMYLRGITHFQRFDRSRSRGTGGSGLGMSIISAVMEESGGQVVIGRSELGGLRIEYTFPLAS